MDDSTKTKKETAPMWLHVCMYKYSILTSYLFVEALEKD